MKHHLFPCLLGAILGFSPGLQARDLGLGVQASVGLAKGGDLSVTAGGGLPLAFGAQANLQVREHLLVKPRIEAWLFSQAHQQGTATPFAQKIDTKVQAQMAGADLLYTFDGRLGNLSAGAGAYLVRWNLDSTDRLTDAAGNTFEQSSSSSWTRPGFGLIATWRFSPHLEAEARWISSDEGYQKLSNNLFLGGVAWRF